MYCNRIHMFSLLMSCLLLFGGLIAMAQEPQLPLAWEGDGKARIVKAEELTSIEFKAEIQIGEDGWVSGEFSNEEGKAPIQRFFYSADDDGARKLIVALVTEEDEPMLILLDGRALMGQFFYGEVLLKPYEKEGEIEKALDLGNQVAEEIYSDYIPKSVENALKYLKPVGIFGIEGAFKEAK